MAYKILENMILVYDYLGYKILGYTILVIKLGLQDHI